MPNSQLLRILKPLPPMLAYVVAAVVAGVCWYGWTYDVFFYSRDLVRYGPLARASGFLTWPITGGKNFLPPPSPFTYFLLTWLIWFVGLRLLLAAWNSLTAKRTVRSDYAS